MGTGGIWILSFGCSTYFWFKFMKLSVSNMLLPRPRIKELKIILNVPVIALEINTFVGLVRGSSSTQVSPLLSFETIRLSVKIGLYQI